MSKQFTQGCDNPQCKVYRATGICDSLTFGSGHLDDLGYWEHPCLECARAFEQRPPEDGPCWPFKQDSDPFIE